jgi:hypothetical protein
VAEFTGNEAMSVYRLDYERMRRIFQEYKIPSFKRICVDEVYARKKSYYRKESRDKRFFTVICDLDSSRVLCSGFQILARERHSMSFIRSLDQNVVQRLKLWQLTSMMLIKLVRPSIARMQLLPGIDSM